MAVSVHQSPSKRSQETEPPTGDPTRKRSEPFVSAHQSPSKRCSRCKRATEQTQLWYERRDLPGVLGLVLMLPPSERCRTTLVFAK